MQEESNNNRSWIKYLITAASGLVFVLVICIAKGVFRMTEAKEIIRIICDAVTLVGVILVCVGLLTVLNKAGAFDGLGYSFKSMIRVMRNYPKDDSTPKTYYDYKKAVDKKRSRKWYLVIVGAGYLVVAVILVFVHGSMA